MMGLGFFEEMVYVHESAKTEMLWRWSNPGDCISDYSQSIIQAYSDEKKGGGICFVDGIFKGNKPSLMTEKM